MKNYFKYSGKKMRICMILVIVFSIISITMWSIPGLICFAASIFLIICFLCDPGLKVKKEIVEDIKKSGYLNAAPQVGDSIVLEGGKITKLSPLNKKLKFSPVPLSREILLKNEFKEYGESEIFIRHLYDDMDLELVYSNRDSSYDVRVNVGFRVVYWGGKIKYLHQLQRLC